MDLRASIWLAVALWGTTSAAGGARRVAVLPVDFDDRAAAEAPAIVDDVLTAALHEWGEATLVPPDAIRAALGDERLLAAADCVEAACWSALAGPLAADEVVAVSVRRDAAGWEVRGVWIAVAPARIVGRASRRIDGDGRALLGELPAFAAALIDSRAPAASARDAGVDTPGDGGRSGASTEGSAEGSGDTPSEGARPPRGDAPATSSRPPGGGVPFGGAEPAGFVYPELVLSLQLGAGALGPGRDGGEGPDGGVAVVASAQVAYWLLPLTGGGVGAGIHAEYANRDAWSCGVTGATCERGGWYAVAALLDGGIDLRPTLRLFGRALLGVSAADGTADIEGASVTAEPGLYAGGFAGLSWWWSPFVGAVLTSGVIRQSVNVPPLPGGRTGGRREVDYAELRLHLGILFGL